MWGEHAMLRFIVFRLVSLLCVCVCVCVRVYVCVCVCVQINSTHVVFAS
jgi:hypothetical protein